MGTTMTVSEARAALPSVIERVLAGEEVTLTRHGQAVAVVVRPDTLRLRRADEAYVVAGQVHDLLARARDVPLRRRPRVGPDRAEELVRDVQDRRTQR